MGDLTHVEQVQAPQETPEKVSAVAVVVVHGIGNQQPMGTVGALVENLYGARSDLERKASVEVRLDRDSKYRDLYRLVLPESGSWPRTDFYELYWQPTFGTGTPGAVLGWMLRMLFKRGRGPQFKQIVTTVRLFVAFLLLAAGLMAMAIWFRVDPEDPWVKRVAEVLPDDLVAWLTNSVPDRLLKWGATALPILGAAGLLLKALARNVLVRVVADASRWFAPEVEDIEERDQVRDEGVELLKRLHELDRKGQPRYARIVVVGHSLGSVVAYDVITEVFDELRRPVDANGEPVDPPGAIPHPDDQRPVDARQPRAWNFVTAVPGKPEGKPLELTAGREYHRVQAALHDEQRRVGVPWLVSDFVTVGSPLTHAQDLLVTEDADFETAKAQNRRPACPPIGERQNREEKWAKAGQVTPQPAAGADGTGPVAFYREDDPRGPLIAHEASPFATIRWTNLYFPMKWWLGGDPVGGPIEPGFGRGVVDIEVELSAPRRTRARVLAIPVAAHTKYWRRVKPGRGDPDRDCVAKLREAIGLRWPPDEDHAPR